jgi:molecular chaperone DnaK (HSP70)
MSRSVRSRNLKTPVLYILTKRSVANDQGSYTTPSFVSFTDKERLIGEAAKNQAAMNPKNTVFDIK